MNAISFSGAVAAREQRLDALPAVAATPALAVTVTDSLDTSDRLASAWDRLAHDASEANAFAERWFVAASVRNLPPPRGTRFLQVWADDGLVGLLILAPARGYARLPIGYLGNWMHYHCFLGTPLVRHGEEQAFWGAILDTLDRAGWATNLLHLNGLVEDGPVHRGLVAAAAARGRPCDTVHRSERALLESALSPDAYYEATVRKKKRKEINRLSNRLREEGTVRCHRLADPVELPAWCDAFLALEASGWKGEAGSSLGSTGETERFFREVAAGAFAAGRLELLRLDLDDRPIAMLVNFLTPPGSFSFKIAFDEGWSRFSPGVMIQIENLRLLENPDIAWMDSCAVEDHPMINSLWGERRPIVRVSVPLGGLRARAAFALCRLLERTSAARRARRAPSPAASPEDPS